MANDPIHQFHIQEFFQIGTIGDTEFHFTNSAFAMGATVAIVAGFLYLATAKNSLIPGRLQSVAELSYEFVASTLRSSAGKEGMRFFPLVFSLFMFILVANFFGMFPYFMTATSQIIITFLLSMTVMLTVVGYGFAKHGFGFLGLFVPSGVPMAVVPLVSAIEVISFLSRPISLSVRLFGNMLAGHITLKVFAGFVASLASLGALGIGGAILPLVMTVGLTALEFLVAFLQAYIFTVLTCMYLNDALHPGH
ncbi:ATP synthase subunit a [Kaistia sp. 32K]|nr:F0F1 ATP synthase subunit A [Kaistia sp. 32K]BCP52611.1 ATP synthase subunit a [Kaistia sp. 32K]